MGQGAVVCMEKRKAGEEDTGTRRGAGGERWCQQACRILTNLTVQFVEFIELVELVEFRLTVELVELQPNCIAIVLKLPPFFLLSIASRGSIQAMGCWSRKIP